MAHNARCGQARGRVCRCTGCGGSRHGWPGYLDLSRDDTGRRASRRRDAHLEWCSEVGTEEEESPAKLASPTRVMLAAATEMVRTDIADHLARRPATARRVEQLGEAVGEKAFPEIVASARRQSHRHPDLAGIAAVLPGHFWCSLLAALVGVADRIDRVDRKVPDQAKEQVEAGPPPDWGEAQELIAETALEVVWDCAAGFLLWWRPDEVVLAMRLLAVFICPDPGVHPDIARLFFSPAGRNLLTGETLGVLRQSVPGAGTA